MTTQAEHGINLSRGWELAALSGNGKTIRLDLANLDDLDFPATLIRKFNCPTGLQEDCQVHFVAENLGKDAALIFNDAPLPLHKNSEQQFESTNIRERLAAFNHLQLTLSSASDAVAMKLCIRSNNN